MFASHLAREGVSGDSNDVGHFDANFFNTNFDFTITGNRVKLGTPEDFFHSKDPSNPKGMLLGFELDGENGVGIEVKFDGFFGIDEFRFFDPPAALLYQAQRQRESKVMIDASIRGPSADFELSTTHPDVVGSVSDAFEHLRNELTQFCAENPRTPAAKIIIKRILSGKFNSEKNKKAVLHQLVAEFAMGLPRKNGH